MNAENNYVEINRALWNERTKHHVKSDFYDMDNFIAGKSSLKDIELALLGDVAGKTILHLQCHFGQDTLSLARMGAKVTGVDLSDHAIETAKELASQMNIDASFICSDLYELSNVLNEKYDIVFTSYGTIGWLPDINRWAEVVSHYLKPGGTFVFAEFHPAVWMFDNDFTYVQYPYLNGEAIVELESGTYADKAADIELQSVGWNHGIGEVVQSLIDAGLSIQALHEYDYSPWSFVGKSVKVAEDKYHIEGMEGKLPLVYALKAGKR